MTVYDNLAFPLRNRGVGEAEVEQRVTRNRRDDRSHRHAPAQGVGAHRRRQAEDLAGARPGAHDVNVIMFDEPLTVIDPHLKWRCAPKLKELHQRIRRTMIYVTHDQTEALTFADRVVVMHDGLVVQQGTPVELFERPQHTFVGHFIGSPGMNVMPCDVRTAKPLVSGQTAIKSRHGAPGSKGAAGLNWVCGRNLCPFADQGLAGGCGAVADTGRFKHRR
jgi:glycerol transport system ATP-binding protein